MDKRKYEKLVSVLLKRGFIFPSFEIYGGVGGFYDFGDLGTKLKLKVQEIWKFIFVKKEDAFEIDTRTVLPRPVLEASGHLERFTDPIIQCKMCLSIYRADHLVEDKLGVPSEGKSPEELTKLIRENKIVCPKCSGELSDVSEFNLLFKTYIGPEQKKKEAFLRPETCQGHFLLFKRLLALNGNKLPVAAAQIGRSYRNEISPRGVLVRLREFDQMELEIFVHPKRKVHPLFHEVKNVRLRMEPLDMGKKTMTAQEAVEREVVPHQLMAYALARSKEFFLAIGIPGEHILFKQLSRDERPFYAIDTWDTVIWTDAFGWIEVTANNDRGEHDLKVHMEKSGEKLTFRDEEGEEIIPHVMEMSYGLDRPLYCVLEHTFIEDDGRGWSMFRFPPKVAPIEVTVLPVVKREDMLRKSKEIYNNLKLKFNVRYKVGYVGRVYARMDEIGCPYCLTVDGETIENNTVTLRDRDTREQVRIKVEEVDDTLTSLLREKKRFSDLKK